MRTRGVRRAGAGGAGSGAVGAGYRRLGCGWPPADLVVRTTICRYSCFRDHRKDDHMKLEGLHHITMLTADPHTARRETAGAR
jgi:hypothetical protein